MSFTSIFSLTCVASILLLSHLSNFQANATGCKANTCVNVDIYYESLCPDSVRFITTQLSPAYTNLKQYLNIEFIPYGKAMHEKDSQGKWTFNCQHGPPECDGNRGQSCGLEAIEKFELLDKKQDIAVSFVDCAMLSGYKRCVTNILNAQAQQYVDNCANSLHGDELLVKHGDKTHSFQPRITFIPTVVINKVYSSKNQHEAKTNFKGLICGYLIDNNDKPSVCM